MSLPRPIGARVGIAVGAMLALAMVASPARANGRFPDASQLIVLPGGPNRIAARTTFGFLFTSNATSATADAGATWDWICEQAVGYGSMQEDPELGYTQSGTMLAGTSEGLAMSTDSGCSWSFVQGGLANQDVIDLVVRPDAPHTVLALTSTYVGDGGLAAYYSQLFITTDDGATWAPYGTPIDPTVITATVEVSVSDPHRVYVSGSRGQGQSRTGSLFVSTNDAATWTEHAIPMNPSTEDGVYISGVDPAMPDRVYVRTALGPTTPSPLNAMSQGRLLVTSDGGATFTVAFHGKGPLFGFALSTDGTKVYVGGSLDGVNVASSSMLAFSQTSGIDLQGLLVVGSTLYATAHASSGFLVGSSTDDGAHFTPTLESLCSIRGPLACNADASTSLCVGQSSWSTLQNQTFECSTLADAGVPPSKPAPGGTGGCQVAPRQGIAGFGLFGVLSGIVALVGRTRRRRIPRG